MTRVISFVQQALFTYMCAIEVVKLRDAYNPASLSNEPNTQIYSYCYCWKRILVSLNKVYKKSKCNNFPPNIANKVNSNNCTDHERGDKHAGHKNHWVTLSQTQCSNHTAKYTWFEITIAQVENTQEVIIWMPFIRTGQNSVKFVGMPFTR